MDKFQIPKFKNQTSTNFENQNHKHFLSIYVWSLKFEYWNLFGI
jgi:hypothetical protein